MTGEDRRPVWLPRLAPLFCYERDPTGSWVGRRLDNEDWNALIKRDHALGWVIWDACRFFLEDSVRTEWRTMSKKDRQARYAEHKAARELRTEARQAKALHV